jgi:uncharacterized protein
MRPVFLDAVGLIALWSRSDQWHNAATAAFDVLESTNRTYVATPFVLTECGNAASRRRFRQNVVELERSLAAAGSLIWPMQEDWEVAWEELDAGIVDCISFAVMRRLGLTEAFTNDQHFAAAGFKTLF